MEIVTHETESYFKISNHDAMRPFFMSIVSDSDHWMFISSNGGLTAGRRNPEYALFPYYTDDKITESADITGCKTIFRIKHNDSLHIWEPFSERDLDKFNISRNLYKSIYGNKLLFEEINHDLQLAFRYQWNSGNEFGFIRKATLFNFSQTAFEINLLDGIQNILPYGVSSDLQRSTSNLVDAYKRSELEPSTGLGIFALSAIIVDKAEPSEALKANTVWSLGLEKPRYLLSSLQLDKFRRKLEVSEEHDIKGEKGAYFVVSDILLTANTEKSWTIIADVNLDHSRIIRLRKMIREQKDLDHLIQKDIDSGTENLIKLVAGADGLQSGADKFSDNRHFSNVLFNIMRGGIFDHNYQIEKQDFVCYLANANREVAKRNTRFIEDLEKKFSQSELQTRLQNVEDADLIRLGIEYLPLKFSRRHGDPSRPWNYFSINTRNEKDGSKVLDYEGNWRDIFQNWEALVHSYPEFIEGMIFKFLNSSTFDGYNPYRITKGGIDWEIIEPDDPWSYIGYWGDHQIIYLLKFLEILENHKPGRIASLLYKEWFVYAAVPYTIKPYDQILKNPKDTIEFDHQWDSAIRKKREQIGADGALLSIGENEIYHVNFLEKILASVLAKISNFVPEAGIWMNTQRPEWNDANNALVGNGVSMVTLYYLHRFLKFFRASLDVTDAENLKISSELLEFYHSTRETLHEFSPLLSGSFSNSERKMMIDSLGKAASDYRQQIYKNGFWGKKRSTSLEGLRTFIQICTDFTEHAIRANQRADKLYHSYNLLTVNESEISISRLGEMLEGQVAVLSSGFLKPEEVLEVLDALKSSALFREDQYSYILYPDKELPGFLQRNNIPVTELQSSELLKKLVSAGNKEIVEKDIDGGLHFNGNFKNAGDLEVALNSLNEDDFKYLLQKEKKLILGIFEKIFNHKAFTGRSGTFYSYEGLGSIYWHMVSKLLLAVQECCLKAIEEKTDPVITGKLLDHYYEIEAGIGVHKPPELYGAFPTDPYSHTPKHRGAQQPGMTGQVKEDILSRFGELGLFVKEGQLNFNPCLLRKDEFHNQPENFEYFDTGGQKKKIPLKQGQMAFTTCQVPVIYSYGEIENISVYYASGRSEKLSGKALNKNISRMIFGRTGEVDRLEVTLKM